MTRSTGGTFSALSAPRQPIGTGWACHPPQCSVLQWGSRRDPERPRAARSPEPSAACPAGLRGVGRVLDPPGGWRLAPFLFYYDYSPHFFPHTTPTPPFPFPFRCFVSLFALGASLRQVPPASAGLPTGGFLAAVERAADCRAICAPGICPGQSCAPRAAGA